MDGIHSMSASSSRDPTQLEPRAHCRDRAFFAFGTARVFARRQHRLSTLRNCITYLGIVVPLTVGAVALSFDSKVLPFFIVPAGVLGIAQLALSAWSLVAKWDDRHASALASLQAQTRLFNEWDYLAKTNPPDIAARIDSLNAEDRRQEAQDLTQGVTKKEQNFGMRAALFQFGNKCPTCGIRPVSLLPSDCDTCGNF